MSGSDSDSSDDRDLAPDYSYPDDEDYEDDDSDYGEDDYNEPPDVWIDDD
jgi:hypothetical protein